MKGSRYAPRDETFRGATFKAPAEPNTPVVSAIVGTNSELLEAVCSLWVVESDVVVDVTYGEGAFWRWSSTLPHLRFDARTGHDARRLPLESSSVDVVVIDPPYRPTHGSSGVVGLGGGFERYALGSQSLDTINDVLDLYRDALVEAFRVLRSGGRVFVKCQDMSYQSRLHMVSIDVLRAMTGAGFTLADHFVLVNKTRFGKSKTGTRQDRARRASSVMWVGGKDSNQEAKP